MHKLHYLQVIRKRIEGMNDRPALRGQHNGQWQDVSWRQLGQQMDIIAQGLMALGHGEGDRVGILSPNQVAWTLADLGILAARGVTVPLYATNTLAQSQYVLKDAGIRILLVGDKEQFANACQLLAQGELSHLIWLGDRLPQPCGDARILTLPQLLSRGDDAALAQARAEREARMDLSDLFTLVYTSGTTGEPKGVMLDFANLAAAMEQHHRRVALNAEDVSLCMLPLSHIYERGWSFYMLYCGVLNVYMSDPRQVMQVLNEVKPTLMCAVPRIYEKVYAQIQAKVAAAPAWRRALFAWGCRLGAKVVARRQARERLPLWLSLSHGLVDRLIFRPIRARFGGRIRMLPIGGARLADEVNRFFLGAGFPIKYGYGMTETLATVSCWEDDSLPLGSTGRPMPGLQIRLGPDSEIQVKGPTMMRGYFNKPEATAEAFTEDGYLRTGDAGYLDVGGNLVFTERLKELMKTSTGKYVAPQLVEGTLGKDRFIEQIAIIADARHYVSALIVPCFQSLEEYARSIGVSYQNKAELLANLKVKAFFEQRINELQQGLAKFEQVKAFTLLPRPFAMEKGELTPTLKLRRKVIEQAFHLEIEAMYAK
ncbi:long-chain fatty acid--CoA ligase [Pseudaeromonas sp. ZJS20]|uniref:AMP-dependent synthetase/ligase n=1 Tax=Pseudaeromonas aegiceratis TaxID=3153928 RepID=UPI00390C4F83